MARKAKAKTKAKTKAKEKPKESTKSKPIPDAVIANRIILLDGQNVMIDRELQKLGGLEEKTLTNSKEIQLIIEYLKKLTALQKQTERQRIGFRRQNEKD